MLRVSSFLKLTRLMLEQCAERDQPILAHDLPAICDLMRHCEIATADMEVRLAGQAVPDVLITDSNIISLAAFVASRAKNPLNLNETKD